MLNFGKIGLALFVTIVAVLMTAVAAFDRGGTDLDRALMVALSVVIVLAVHLLPAISRRSIAWVVWAGCLLCAIYGHLTFLVHSNQRASQHHSEVSTLTIGTEKQIAAAREALAEITARPMAVVAAELANTSDRRIRSALNIELDQSKKAQQIRDELRELESKVTSSKVNGAVDPVTQKVAEVFGVTEAQVSVVIGLTLALLLELIGAVLWFEALRGNPEIAEAGAGESNDENSVTQSVTRIATPAVTQSARKMKSSATQKVTAPVTPVATHENSNAVSDATLHVTQSESNAATLTTQSVTTDVVTPVTQEESNATQIQESNESTDQLEILKSAIQSGKAKATVSGIRDFLGCSQSRAMELRRALT